MLLLLVLASHGFYEGICKGLVLLRSLLPFVFPSLSVLSLAWWLYGVVPVVSPPQGVPFIWCPQKPPTHSWCGWLFFRFSGISKGSCGRLEGWLVLGAPLIALRLLSQKLSSCNWWFGFPGSNLMWPSVFLFVCGHLGSVTHVSPFWFYAAHHCGH